MNRPPTTGQLDRRITVEHDDGAARSTSGQHAESWQTFATVWARVMPGGGNEVSPAGEVQGVSPTEVWFRYTTDTAGLTAAMRLNLGGRILNITAVSRFNERGFWWVVQAIEAEGAPTSPAGDYFGSYYG